MGTALPNLPESEFFKNGDNFPWLQDWVLAHGSGNEDGLGSNKLRRRVGILQQHRNYLLEIPVQFIQGFRLRVCTRKARNVAHVQARVGTPLNHRDK